MSSNLTSRIAIIGAGVSGLTAGLELRERGFKHVTIFEKEHRAGGKTFSYPYKGAHFDLGSMMFSRTSEIARLADRYRVPYCALETKDFYYSKGKYLDPLTYTRQSYSLPDIFRSLHGLYRAIKTNQLTQAGYGEIDPELLQDFRSYLKAHRLEAAASSFQPAIIGLGYGYYETTPAVYSLKIMASMLNASLIRSLLTSGNEVCYFPAGWMELWEKIAEDLGVRKNASISSIQRKPKQGVRITAGRKTEVFDKLIITAPLNHAYEYLDVTAKEKILFSKIKSNRMISTLVEASTPMRTTFLADNSTPDRLGHVLGIEAYIPESRCSVLYQTVPEGMTKPKIRRLIIEDLKELGYDVQKIVTQKEWEYFYHVFAEDLSKGFYTSLNKLQGSRNTFYAGSVLNYETVDHCQQFATHIIETYF